jgi:hypothetical protein
MRGGTTAVSSPKIIRGTAGRNACPTILDDFIGGTGLPAREGFRSPVPNIRGGDGVVLSIQNGDDTDELPAPIPKAPAFCAVVPPGL